MRLSHLAKMLAQHWPFPNGRAAVIAGYATVGAQHQHMLADFALRNYVFGDLPDDPDKMHVAEGRRRAALELMKLCGVGYAELYALIERKPKTRGED